MGIMSIMSREGDTKIEWDADDDKSILVAKKKFKELLGKGFKAFRINSKGKSRGSMIYDFPAHAEELLLIPPMVGG